ncbi:MAG TPA: rhodanese-like domain-containing protein [Symbiobacteriaceae bacterium]|nr:rhodanese-like domain-containing protein [Symbiobacteriaceae bacterium]
MFAFSRSRSSGPIQTTAAELQARLARGERPAIIDVRTPEEYAFGHIPGARLMPLDRLPQMARSLHPDEEIVLVCRSGNRSMQAYRFLERLGYRQLRNLDGGMLDWTGPVAR